LGALGPTFLPVVEARLDPADREEGRTAVNIGKLGASTAQLVAAARRAGRAAFVLAGDDTAAVGVVAGLQQADGSGIGIVWLDAHGDFNTPETSYSGILAGMPVAIIAGLAGPLWRAAAGLAEPIATGRIIVAGVRDLDEQEAALLKSTEARVVSADEVRAGTTFELAAGELAARCPALLLHVDLDVLDPRFVPSSSTPSANGLSIDEATAAISVVLRTGRVAVVTVSSLNPGGGQRGERSIQSTLKLIEAALADWQSAPPAAGA
jgi:arginase